MSREIYVPNSADEPLLPLCSADELHRVTVNFYNEVLDLLSQQNIPLQDSHFRTKQSTRIHEKLVRTGNIYPVLDIHGVRVILETPFIQPAISAIETHWPSPQVFPGGLPAQRDYSDPETKQRFNPASLAVYEAIHLNVVIAEGAKIAEVHLQTPEQFAAAEAYRAQYEERQRQR